MANDATDSPDGMVIDMESCSTSRIARAEGQTLRPTCAGHAGNAIGIDTQAHNSRLSAEEQKQLARIARDRANRWMISVPDVDFLLELIWRLSA